MKLLYTLLIFLMGCSGPLKMATATIPLQETPSPYITSDFSSDDVRRVVEYAVEEFDLDDLAPGWTFVLTDRYLVLQNRENPEELALAEGITLHSHKTVIVFAYQKCLADSDLIHQVAHALGHEHSEEMYQIVQEVKQNAIEDMCSGYKPEPNPDPTLMITEEI